MTTKHNLLGLKDARAEADRLEEDIERLKFEAGETWATLAIVGEILGVPDSTPHHGREVEKAARALVARVEELEGVLRPFEGLHKTLSYLAHDDRVILVSGGRKVTYGHIRAAAAALDGAARETR